MTTVTTQARAYQYDHTIGMDDFAGRSFRNLADLALGLNEMLYVLQRGESLHHNVAVKICNVGEGMVRRLRLLRKRSRSNGLARRNRR